jgi:hypothetical protein
MLPPSTSSLCEKAGTTGFVVEVLATDFPALFEPQFSGCVPAFHHCDNEVCAGTAHWVSYWGGDIWSVSGEKRTSRDHRKSVAFGGCVKANHL